MPNINLWLSVTNITCLSTYAPLTLETNKMNCKPELLLLCNKSTSFINIDMCCNCETLK